jgi:hypothetical protein
MLMIECSHCPGTICTVCSHREMLMIECSHCPGTNCTYGTKTMATLNQHVTVRTYCTYGTRTTATLNHQHVTVRTYCTYGTRTVATLNHQHVTENILYIWYQDSSYTQSSTCYCVECSHCPGTICTVINVLAVTC